MKFFDDITEQTTLLTPNRRLSAVISKKYCEWQILQGKKAWKTLDILPLYPTWLDKLWRHYTASHIQDHKLLLSSRQEQVLWEKIVRESPENDGLLQASETAKLAKSAAEILKKWQVRLKNEDSDQCHDVKAFLNWSNKFEMLCNKNHWLSPASLPDVIAELISQQKLIMPKKIILLGFTELAPQYDFLLKECQKSGIEVIHHEFEDNNQSANFISINDNETEIRTMAQWASAVLSQNNNNSYIGCIVPNLESCRETILRIFSELLEPNYFNISAGKSLSSYPIIHDALALIQMIHQPFTKDQLIHLLRSPFIIGAESERLQRADAEIILLKKNNSTLNFTTIIPFLTQCPLLRKSLNQLTVKNGKHSPFEWITIFNDYLQTMGWPGERSLNSQEYQVVQHAWLPVLNEFASLSTMLGKINFNDALHYLKLITHNVMFQPESPEAPIQILGLLEAADLPFDYSWIIGLTDSAWPPKPKPNPFIPLHLQKKLNMPNSSADRELIYCQKLTNQLKRSSKHIIFSYSLQQDDVEFRPSALIKSFTKITLKELRLKEFSTIAQHIYRSSQIEKLFDNNAPLVSDNEKIHGGSKIFKSQAECGFKAFAEMRLHVKGEQPTSLGLNKLDQGNAVHQALQYIWQELKQSEHLHKKSDTELQELIHNSVKIALENQSIDRRFFPLEFNRLEKLLWQWLQLEKERPAFKVIALEKEMTATIGNISAKFRIDRIDEVTNESQELKQLIIDYKTGKNTDAKHWFGERLEEPQLPIYTIINSDIPIGIAFAKINATEMKLIGASESQINLHHIKTISDIKHADAASWTQQMEKWRQYLTQLSDDFYHGRALADPKHREICERCGLQSLCRIFELVMPDPSVSEGAGI